MYHFFTALLEPFSLLYILTAAGLVVLWRKRPQLATVPLGTPQSRRRLLLVTVPFVILGIISTPVISHLVLGSLEWRYSLQTNLPRDRQAIVVLSGYVRPPSANAPEVELESATLLRCLHAARLYHSRPCTLLVCGGKVDPATPGPTLAQAMHDFLLYQGVKQKDLLIEDKSTTTYENARYARDLLSERGISRIALVTSAIHMRRAEACFRKQALEVIPAACDFRERGFAWSVTSFLPNSYAYADTQYVVHEWLGIAWYWLHGRI